MLQCLNRLRHIVLHVLVTSWRENDVLDFRGFGTQINGGQNAVSTVALYLFDISSAMRGVG